MILHCAAVDARRPYRRDARSQTLVARLRSAYFRRLIFEAINAAAIPPANNVKVLGSGTDGGVTIAQALIGTNNRMALDAMCFISSPFIQKPTPDKSNFHANFRFFQ